MPKYKEFAPETYLCLDTGDIVVRLERVLQFIVRSSISFSDTTKDWNIDQLKNFLNENYISVIKIDRNECLLARNLNGEIIDETANKAKELSFLDSESILTLVKLIQQENPLSLEKGKEYKELLFAGFYLNLETGKFCFNCERVVNSFINLPYFYQKTSASSINITYHEFELLAKEKEIPTYFLETAKIELLQVPKPDIFRSQSKFSKSNSKFIPFYINDATKTSIRTIDGNGLKKLDHILNNLKEPSDNSSCYYLQIGPGIIREKVQPQKKLYSLQTLLESIEATDSRPHIDITKKAVEKQVKKLINSDPKLYKKEVIADSNIAKNSRQILDLSNRGGHKETYINQALYLKTFDFYKSNYAVNNHEFEYELINNFPQFEDMVRKSNSSQMIVTLDDINATAFKFGRRANKISNSIDKLTSWIRGIEYQAYTKIEANVKLRKKIKDGWQKASSYYSVWQEISNFEAAPEENFIFLVKEARCKGDFIAGLQPQNFLTKKTDAIELLTKTKKIDLEIYLLNYFKKELKTEFSYIKIKPAIYNMLKKVNSSSISKIKSEKGMIDYKKGISVPVDTIKDLDNSLRKQENNKIVNLMNVIVLTISDLNQLISGTVDIRLNWEDLREELQYFDYAKISEKNRPRAKQTIGDLLKQVTNNLSL